MGMLSGPWTWKRIVSFSFLALAFNKRQLRHLFRGRADDGGERRFLENFSAEGMAPLTTAHEALIERLSRCVGCGMCEAVCPHPLERWPAYARGLQQAVYAANDLPAACGPDCRACEGVCPAGVPLMEIPAFVRRAGVAPGLSG